MATDKVAVDDVRDANYNSDEKDPERHEGFYEHRVAQDNLARRLSARQVQMIAIGGTIGTGLFLGKFFPAFCLWEESREILLYQVYRLTRQALGNHLQLAARHLCS